MADERIGLTLDLGHSIADAKELDAALRTVSTTVSANVAPALKTVDAAAKESQKAAAEFGRGIQSIAYIAQDFTSVLAGGQGLGRALGSIQNNIPQLITQFGGGAGLAGVIGLASVGVGLLVDNFGKLYAAWSGGKTEEQVKAMEQLAKAADAARVAIEKQIEAARKQQSPDQKAAGDAVKAQTGGPDFDKVAENALGLDETQFTKKRNDLEAEAESYKQVARRARGKGQNTRGKAAADLEAETRGLIEALNQDKLEAQALVVAARNGDMDAYDELLKRTTGDVHDQLAAADPRKAGMRGLAQGRAKAQIADFIGDMVNPIATGLKNRLKSERQGINQGKAIDAFSDEGEREAEKVLGQGRRQDARNGRAGAKSDVQDLRDAERERKEGGKRFLANPDYSPARLRDMDQKQAANHELKQLIGLQNSVMGLSEQGVQRMSDLQQLINQLNSRLQRLQQGARTANTRMGRVRPT